MVLRLDLTTARPADDRPRHRYGQQLARRHAIRHDDLPTNDYAPSSLVRACALWIAPWDARRYPGRQRVLQEATGRAIDPMAINHWRSGNNTMPAWAARAWAAVILSRCRVGERLAAALLAHAEAIEAKPRRGANFRKDRASGVAPSGIGARGKLFAKGDNETS